jgi:protein phosphatase 1L
VSLLCYLHIVSLAQMASGLEDQPVYGHYLMKGKSRHAMEDYFVAEMKKVNNHDLGLFAIYDGHLGHHVADYLQRNNILKEVCVVDLSL